MTNWFTSHHIWAKLLALALAIALWAIVISTDNPERRMDMSDVPIQFIGESQIRANSGLVITSVSDTDVSVKLNGAFATLGALTKDSIIVRADVSKITVPGSFYLEYDVSTPIGVTYVGSSPSRIQATFDKIVAKELEVRVEYDGELEEGIEVTEAVVSPKKLTVYGVTSEMENAEYAVVKLKASDLTKSYSGDAEYYVADADGKRMDSEFTSSLVEKVHVEIPVFKTKSVPVKVTKKGTSVVTPNIINVELMPSEVTVYGEAGLMNRLKEINVGTVDAGNFVTSDTITFPVTLPEGVKFSGNAVSSVEAVVSLDGISSAQIAISEIALENVPENVEAEVESSSVTVTVRGKDGILKGLTPDDFEAVIDLTGRSSTVGRQLVPMKIACKNDGVEICGNSYTAVVVFTEK